MGEWLRESFPRPPDVVVNLTPNSLGGILAYATGAREIRGMAAYRTWELGTRPDWASYALVVSRARQANPFNLVDLFLREGGLTPDGRGLELAVPPEAEAEVKEFWQGLQVPPGTKLVGLFPGASKPERCWPTDRFVRTDADFWEEVRVLRCLEEEVLGFCRTWREVVEKRLRSLNTGYFLRMSYCPPREESRFIDVNK